MTSKVPIAPIYIELDKEPPSWHDRFGQEEETAESLPTPKETQQSGLYRKNFKLA